MAYSYLERPTPQLLRNWRSALEAAAALLPQNPQSPGLHTRFAPSLTGYLHLGHLWHLLLVYGFARVLNASVLLRLEDHDQGRYRAEYEQAILQDLVWLGLEQPDILATPRPARVQRQRDRGPAYQKALDDLAQAGYPAYGCPLSRKALDAWYAEHPDFLADIPLQGERPYPNLSRRAGLPPGPPQATRLPLPEHAVTFQDLHRGPQTQTPARQCGDLLVRDRRGNWTYNFCVAVDDLAQEINLIIRGVDLLHTTGRQLLLRKLLNAEAPRPILLHHPLLADSAGQKLSKRQQPVSLTALREQGAAPRELLDQVLDFLPHPRPRSFQEWVQLLAN